MTLKWLPITATQRQAKSDSGMVARLGALEIIRNVDGNFNVLARGAAGIGWRAVCQLPADYDFTQHLNSEERAILDADEANLQAALIDVPESSYYFKFKAQGATND